MPTVTLKAWTGRELWTGEAASVAEAVRQALTEGANLERANLERADLERANLKGADLERANLYQANLERANLERANLYQANLERANLERANLERANLEGANLYQANLKGANLYQANLTPIRDDFWAVLAAVPGEVPLLREAILAGRIDGSAYKGNCACLVGTLANARHCDYDAIPGLTPNADRPAERFFLAIRPGDTPGTSQFARLALEWTDDFLARFRAAIPALRAEPETPAPAGSREEE